MATIGSFTSNGNGFTGTIRTLTLNVRAKLMRIDTPSDRDAVAEEMKAWSAGFSKPAESRDVVAVRLRLGDVPDTAAGRETFGKAIRCRLCRPSLRRASTSPRQGILEARIVAAMAGADRERFRVREERNGDGSASARLCFDRASEALIVGRIATAVGHGG